MPNVFLSANGNFLCNESVTLIFGNLICAYNELELKSANKDAGNAPKHLIIQ